MNKSAKTKIVFSIFLILVVLTSSIYFLMPEKVRIDIENTRTKYSVYENGNYVLAATEYVNLYDGTTKMKASNRSVIWYNDSEYVYAVRTSIWKDNITTIQTYIFNKTNSKIEQFPDKNEFECINCEGKIVHYEIRDILYNGETKTITSPFSFGHNMKIEWQKGSYYSKVFQQLVSDKIIIKYKPISNYEKYSVRLFDPNTVTLNYPIDNYVFETSSGNFNCTSITTSTVLKNMSFYTNTTGIFSQTRSLFNFKHDYFNDGSINSTLWTAAVADFGVVSENLGSLKLTNEGLGCGISYIKTKETDMFTNYNYVKFKVANWTGSCTCTGLDAYIRLYKNSSTYSTIYDYPTNNLTGIIFEVYRNTSTQIIFRKNGGSWTSTETKNSNNHSIQFYTFATGCGSASWIMNIEYFKWANVSYNDIKYISDTESDQTFTSYFPYQLNNKLLWSCRACGSDGTCYFAAANRTIDYDHYNPTVNLTYPINYTYTTNVSKLNYTYSDDYPDSCWYSKDNGVTNYSVQTMGTNFTNINGIIGSNHWKVYCNDTGNRQTNDDIYFTITRIKYESNSDNSSSNANFVTKSNIFVNISILDAYNVTNVTFNLYTNNGIYNKTIYTDSRRSINWTGLSSDMYFWNVSFCNNLSQCYSLDERYYGIETMNFDINGLTTNLSLELGVNLTFNATTNFYNVSVDFSDERYGANYSISKWSNYFSLVITYFLRNTFSDGSLSKVFNGFYVYNNSYVNTSNLTFNAHKYDEIDSLYFNISGSNGPEDISFYKVNSSDIDRTFYGRLIDSLIYVTTIWDSSSGTNLKLSQTNVSYDSYGEQLVYLYVDDNADINSFTLNFSGFKSGFDFYDPFNNYSFVDTILTNCSIKGGKVIPRQTNYQNFTYDTFSDNKINGSLWVNSTDDYLNVGGNSYTVDLDTLETTNSLKTRIRLNRQGDCSVGNIDATGYREVYENLSSFDLASIDKINFDYSFSYFGKEGTETSSINNRDCDALLKLTLGNTQFWSIDTNNYGCEYNDYGSCNEYGTTIGNLTFSLEKQINETWKVKISGTERHYSFGDDGVCGNYNTYLNWTNSSKITTYDSCTTTFSSVTNTFYITPSTYLLNLNISNKALAHYEKGGDCNGCDEVISETYLKVINYTKSSYSNCTIISSSVFDSSNNINSMKINSSHRGSATFYVSSDNGDNWQNILLDTETPIINVGKHVKYQIKLVGTGYDKFVPYIEWINLTQEGDYPSNISFDFGNDGINDYSIYGYINETNGSLQVDLSLANLSYAFSSENPSVGEHAYEVPLEIHSDTAGTIQLSNINLSYNPNPVSLNSTSIQEYIPNFTEISTFDIVLGADNSTSSSSINISDIIYEYAGGNYTINITVHNDDYSIKFEKVLTFFYSRWDYEFIPTNIEWILFTPKIPTSKNVTPSGQTNNIPIINITNYGYGGKNSTLSVYQNSTISCVNTTLSLNNYKVNGSIINSNWLNLTNMSYLDEESIYLWSDYQCSYSNWYLFNPSIYFRMCCEDCICSEDLS